MLTNRLLHIQDVANRSLFELVKKHYEDGLSGKAFRYLPDLQANTPVLEIEREAMKLFKDIPFDVVSERDQKGATFLYATAMRAWQTGARIFQQNRRFLNAEHKRSESLV